MCQRQYIIRGQPSSPDLMSTMRPVCRVIVHCEPPCCCRKARFLPFMQLHHWSRSDFKLTEREIMRRPTFQHRP